jgi:hypothetical protein
MRPTTPRVVVLRDNLGVLIATGTIPPVEYWIGRAELSGACPECSMSPCVVETDRGKIQKIHDRFWLKAYCRECFNLIGFFGLERPRSKTKKSKGEKK